MRQSLPVHHLHLHPQTISLVVQLLVQQSASPSTIHLADVTCDVRGRSGGGSCAGAGRGACTMAGDAGGVGVRSGNAALNGSSA